MIYRIAALQNGIYEWVTDLIDSEEVVHLEVQRLIPIWGETILLVFRALDAVEMATARLSRNALIRDTPAQQRRARAEAVDLEVCQEFMRRALETGEGADHDFVYRFILPTSGQQESVWCFMLGKVQRGDYGPEPRLREIKK